MNRRIQLTLLALLLLMAVAWTALSHVAAESDDPPIACCEATAPDPYPYPYPPPTDGRAWMPSIFNSYPYPQPEVKR